MHEMSLCESVVRILAKEAREQHFRQVRVVHLRIGAFSCASPEAMDFCFRVVTKGTLAENARLEMERTPGYAWCMSCGQTVVIRERHDCCPQCRSYELQVTGGDELQVTELEVE